MYKNLQHLPAKSVRATTTTRSVGVHCQPKLPSQIDQFFHACVQGGFGQGRGLRQKTAEQVTERCRNAVTHSEAIQGRRLRSKCKQSGRGANCQRAKCWQAVCMIGTL